MDSKNENVAIIDDAFDIWCDQGRSEKEKRIVETFIKVLLKETADQLGSDFKLTPIAEKYLYESYRYKSPGYDERQKELARKNVDDFCGKNE